MLLNDQGRQTICTYSQQRLRPVQGRHNPKALLLWNQVKTAAHRQAKSWNQLQTTKLYHLRINGRATPTKLLLAHKQTNGDNLRPAPTSGNDHKTNASNHQTGGCTNLTSNSNANTNPLLNKRIVYEQKLIETRCCRQRKVRRILFLFFRNAPPSPSPPKRKRRAPVCKQLMATVILANSHQMKPVSTTLPCVNTPTGK